MKSDSITVKNCPHGETKSTAIEKNWLEREDNVSRCATNARVELTKAGRWTSRKEDTWKWRQSYKVTIKCSFTWNQSIVQQLMREGNILIRLLKASPMGLIANTTCRLARTRSMKKLYMASGVDSILRPWKQKDEKVTHLGRKNTTGHKTTSCGSNQS